MRKLILFLLISNLFNIIATTKTKVLIGCIIKNNSMILKNTLKSLMNLKQEDMQIDFSFIKNTNIGSKCNQLLDNFNLNCEANCIIYTDNFDDDISNDNGKIAYYKKVMIDLALQKDYDYLFLINSADILLHPKVLEHLINMNKDILGEIILDKENQHLNCLQQSDVKEVDFLDSCILISKKALQSGVNFDQIKNLSYQDNNKHFSIRANSLGFQLFLDSHYPVIRADNEIKSIKKSIKPKLTLAMCVKNEADRYLSKVLEDAKEYIDEAVIIDDASTDNTREVCLQILNGIPTHIISNSSSKYFNGTDLREQLWNELIKTEPEWILFLDADQIFEPKFKEEVKNLINQTNIDVFCFREFDFWQDNYYRSDPFWSSHQTYKPFLIRYKNDFEYKWTVHPLHWGRIPYNVMQLPNAISQIRLLHYGYLNPKDRLEKIKRNKVIDPENKFRLNAKYDSMLDENPKLYSWYE